MLWLVGLVWLSRRRRRAESEYRSVFVVGCAQRLFLWGPLAYWFVSAVMAWLGGGNGSGGSVWSDGGAVIDFGYEVIK